MDNQMSRQTQYSNLQSGPGLGESSSLNTNAAAKHKPTSPAEEAPYSRTAPPVKSATASPARFQCTKCPKSFSRIENLTRHQATHDEVAKFLCAICGKRFTRSDLLNRHRRIHSPGVPTASPKSRESSTDPSRFSTPGIKDSPSSTVFLPNSYQQSLNVDALKSQTASPLPLAPAYQGDQQRPNPDAMFLRNILSMAPFQESLTVASAVDPTPDVHRTVPNMAEPVTNPITNPWQSDFVPGFEDQSGPGYMGTYDADIFWTFDNYRAGSSSEPSMDQDMNNNANDYAMPSFSGVAQVQPYTPIPNENPIDAADNEDEDTNDWPDKAPQVRRAPRIIPLRLIPISWEPLLDEARTFARTPPVTQPFNQTFTPALRKILLNSLNGARYDLVTPEISDTMFPPIEVLNFFLALYIQHLHPRFPVLHLPTFSVHTSPPLLLVAMILLGSSHSNIDRGRSARLLHGPLRTACTRLSELDTRWFRNLDSIHTYFLLCLAGTWSGSKESYEFSEGTRGILVTSCRRMRLFDNRPSPIDATRYQDAGCSIDDAKWLAWIETEKGKRLGLSVYMYDCQFPALFNIQHFVSKAECTNLTFPCDEYLWQAPTAQAWLAMLPNGLPAPQYWLRAFNSIVLHRCIQPPPPVVPNTGEFVKTLLLYALHTHIYDWRAATSMAAPTGVLSGDAPFDDIGDPLRERRLWLLDALDSWEEIYLTNTTDTASLLLHRLGYMALDLNLSDMHLIAGRSNNPEDGNFAERNLRKWANSKAAPTTMRHVSNMLQICYQHVDAGIAAKASFEIAVGLFTGGIVCWAYAGLRRDNDKNGEEQRWLAEAKKASGALKIMGCWRMSNMFGRILSGFDTKI